jgi:hypothetical protein
MIIHYGNPQKGSKDQLRKPDSSWARSNMEKSNQFAQHLEKFSHHIPGTLTTTKLKPI